MSIVTANFMGILVASKNEKAWPADFVVIL